MGGANSALHAPHPLGIVRDDLAGCENSCANVRSLYKARPFARSGCAVCEIDAAVGVDGHGVDVRVGVGDIVHDWRKNGDSHSVGYSSEERKEEEKRGGEERRIKVWNDRDVKVTVKLRDFPP